MAFSLSSSSTTTTPSSTLLHLLILSLLTLSHQQPPLDTAEQESVYLALESVNPQTPWRSLFPDDLCLVSAPHGVLCGFFPSNSSASDDGGGNDGVLVPHIIELNFGYVSDSSENPPCSTTTSAFPSSVFSLPHLRKLFFYRCFTAANNPVFLPSSFAAAVKQPRLAVVELEELIFMENPSLSGSLSGAFLRNFASLRRLILIGSNISGGIPAEITNLPSLEQLTISGNPSFGKGNAIPENLGFLTKLKVLDLSGNGFQGTIPESVGQLKSLIKLDLSHNGLTGRIPDSLKGLEKVEFVDLSYNRFGNHGIPLFLGRMSSLKEVYLSGNPLGGTIPEIWEDLGGIIGIGLSGVGLVGNIPASMGVFLGNLCYISLDNNKLEGSVPEEFGLLKNVHEMNLENNNLSGRIPFSAPFATKIGKKLKVEGNSGLCIEEELRRSVQEKGNLGNLKTCNSYRAQNLKSAPFNGSPSLSVNWDLVVFVVGFWSFSWVWTVWLLL